MMMQCCKLHKMLKIDEKTELDLKQRHAQDLKSLGITLTLKDDEEDVLDVPDLPVPGQGPWKPKGGSKRDRSRDHVAIDEEDPSSDRVIGVAGELPKNNAAGENKRAGTDARGQCVRFFEERGKLCQWPEECWDHSVTQGWSAGRE